MKKKLEALIKNKTWEITDFLYGTRPVSSKQIYKLKRKAHRSINKFKAELVAKDTWKSMVLTIASLLLLWQR